MLLHLARTMTSTDQDTGDLIQDTLLRAYEGIGRFAVRIPAPGSSQSCATPR
jgi:DNA-directed RNA polymerase specialized sigma24 family protein